MKIFACTTLLSGPDTPNYTIRPPQILVLQSVPQTQQAHRDIRPKKHSHSAHPPLFSSKAALQPPTAVTRTPYLKPVRCLSAITAPSQNRPRLYTPRRRFSTTCRLRAPGRLRNPCRYLRLLFSSLGWRVRLLWGEVGFERWGGGGGGCVFSVGV